MSNPEILRLTAEIVAAHVGHNQVPVDQIHQVISSVYSTLDNISAEPAEPVELIPAVSVKKSVFPDYIICLEDGKKLKMLKRHLATSYNMTPEQYRERWGLRSDYPMVAPDYASRRSELAKNIGLGRKPGTKIVASPDVGAEEEDAEDMAQASKASSKKSSKAVAGPNKAAKITIKPKSRVSDVIERAKQKAEAE